MLNKLQSNIVGANDCPIFRSPSDGDLELSREELKLGVISGPLSNQLGIRSRICNLIDSRARKLVGCYVPNGVSTRLNCMHIDIGERI